MSRLEVLEVKREGGRSARYGKYSVDAPVAKMVNGNGGMAIDGWLIGHEQNTTTVVVFCQGALLRTTLVNLPRKDVLTEHPEAGENCGFSTALSAYELPAEFEVVLAVVYLDGEIVPLATIKGRREITAAAESGFLQPLVVTSLGRSGTTFLMRLLAGHPEIVVHRQHPYETKAGAYWMHMLRCLTQGETHEHVRVTWEQGDWTRPPFVALPTASWEGLTSYLDGPYGELAAGFCGRATEGFYRRVGESQGQAGAKFFCEKMPPNGLMNVFANVYGGAKEIFLIRDFRDVAASVFAFNAKRGFAEFGREHVASDAAYIPELRRAAERLLENVQGRKGQALVVRYEDLMADVEGGLVKILEYLGLPTAAEVRQQMVKMAGALTGELKEHRTTASVEDSMGRWKRDLSPELQQICRDNFDHLLPEFGYREEDVAAVGGVAGPTNAPAAAPEPRKRWYRRFM